MRQDIRGFKYEMVNIFKMNEWKTPAMKEDQFSKKSRNLVSMILWPHSPLHKKGKVSGIF